MKLFVLANFFALIVVTSTACKARQTEASAGKMADVSATNPFNDQSILSESLDGSPHLTDAPLNSDNISAGDFEAVQSLDELTVADRASQAPNLSGNQLSLTDGAGSGDLAPDVCTCVKTNLGYCGVWKASGWVNARYYSPGQRDCDVNFCKANFAEEIKAHCGGIANASNGQISLGGSPSPTAAAGGGTKSATAGAEDGAGGQCGCKTLRVDCNQNQTGGSGATCFSAECRMAFPPDICMARGYTHGQRVDVAQILNAPLPRPENVDIYRECSVRHEAKHGCSDFKTPGLNQREVVAYTLSLNCFWHYYQALGCDKNSGHYLCGYASANYNSHRAALFLNACFASGEARASCVAKCQTAPQLDHQYCAHLDELYGTLAAQQPGDKPK